MNHIDAFILLSFGGPETPKDVIPFLRNVTRGRDVPEERLRKVATHYDRFGGKSPINDQNRELLAELGQAFEERGLALPLYWGNRNWHPFLADTLKEVANAEHRNVLIMATSAYSSYSSCRQYNQDIERARQSPQFDNLNLVRLPPFFNREGFLAAQIDRTRAAIGKLSPSHQDSSLLLFTAHSIPMGMARGCEYENQLRGIAEQVSREVDRPFELVYQSRSGPPRVPWLEPDVCARLREIAGQKRCPVVLVPIGFLSDHMEVRYDLDVEVKELCESLQLPFVRAATVGTHSAFVDSIADWVVDLAKKPLIHPIDPQYCNASCCPRTTE